MILILLLSLTFSVPTNINDDRSLCPGCFQFINQSVRTAIATKDFFEISDIKIYSYGNAKETKLANGSYEYTCQHGPQQCIGNLYETCASQYQWLNHLKFVVCITFYHDFDHQAANCANQSGIPYNQLLRCVRGQKGNQLQHEVAVRTQNLNPPHKYTPWIVINNVHDQQKENLVRENILNFVCKQYNGTKTLPAFCNTYYLQ